MLLHEAAFTRAIVRLQFLFQSDVVGLYPLLSISRMGSDQKRRPRKIYTPFLSVKYPNCL